MKIYLAGAITGNLIKEWKNYMNLYLASIGNDLGNGGRLKKHYNDDMKLFLASTGSVGIKGEKGDYVIKESIKKNEIHLKDIYVLESFYYIRKQEWMFPLIHQFKDFLLDSGAFTFFGDAKTSMKQYIDDYISFINKHDIKHFIELDLYTLPEYGLKKTEEIRAYIEEKTNKKSIPVFHKICGIEYYKQLCEDYSYIAISASGKYDSTWTRSNPSKLKNMLLYAKSKKVKVHGLGYTSLKMLDEMPFDSIDSTSWLSGNQFGAVYYFDGRTIKKQGKKPGQRVKTNEVAIHNFSEWVKFQKYAENNL